MSKKQPLPICEVFESIQGEGATIGWPALFIRMGGCKVSCKMCCEKGTKITLANGQKKSIEELQIGDVLLTPRGETIVDATMSRSIDELVEIELESGHILHCTLDHPLFKKDGTYTTAENLCVGDEVVIEK